MKQRHLQGEREGDQGEGEEQEEPRKDVRMLRWMGRGCHAIICPN